MKFGLMDARFEVLMAVNIHVKILRAVTPCSAVVGYHAAPIFN
jgi:hypothetical protein